MRKYMYGAALAIALALVAGPAVAQQTTGNIMGRVLDQQGGAIPGVTVTAKNPATGFTRSEVSDSEGVYRLTGLPVGVYVLTTELQGFNTMTKSDIELNVAQTLTVDFELKIASLAESVNVTGATPLIETASSSVGGVVDVRRVENLPLNGRQFANLAATIPGVGMGFHSDPTKSTQYSPQIGGGNGRNVNYQIDGGDNNDDTVGGLLQLFPLEAIQEFNFITARYKAEYGRSNGGVMNIVTKSGTNTPQGSWFTLVRDKSLNAKTETERRSNVDKQDYRRYQFGGSFGGPIQRDKAHFFVAYERTQQDTRQAVDTLGLFPNLNGVYDTPYRENLITAKGNINMNASQYVTVRWGRNTNTQPYGAAAKNPPNNWGDSSNKFNSFNMNHNWVVGGSKLNEFIFQVADFRNHISPGSTLPNENFPNGVTVGQNGNTPQTTEQKKWQFRDDFSWHRSGMGGLGHDFKAGFNFIYEPRLFITFNTGRGVPFFTHVTDDLNGPISGITFSDGDSSPNIPNKQYAVFLQDDWRLSDRLTLNVGVRYDLVTGIQFDQSNNPNFVLMQRAGSAGAFNGIIGLENFGKEPKDDKNNIQPRLGLAWDIRGNGHDVVRVGWGIYTDFGYTNSNGLFAAADAQGRYGPTFSLGPIPTGIRLPNGTLYTINRSNLRDFQTLLASQNEASALNLFGQYVDPGLEQPETRQASAGWSHELNPSTVFNADFVHIDGRKLNLRPRLNTRIPGTTTRRINALVLAATGQSLSPNTDGNRPAVSRGKSRYDALILSFRRRMTNNLDYSASYTLSKARSNIGTTVDELNSSNIQDATNPFDNPLQFGPTYTDARHRVSLSALIRVKGGINIAPIFTARSATPPRDSTGTGLGLTDGRDRNLDGRANDIPDTAYSFDGFNADGTPKIKEDGACKTVLCGRGAGFSQMNLRVSKVFDVGQAVKAEIIGEVFNLFNAINPSNFNTRVFVPTTGARDRNLLVPKSFAGDFQQPEQRVGQVGFRITF